jgi:sulfate adenylyltransferase subunit 2
MKDLVSKTEYILRHAKASFRNPAVLWSTGKDSTAMLSLIRNAFLGKVPFPVIHLDTGRKFREIYEFRNRLADEWKLDLIVGKNEEAIANGVCPERDGHFGCCTILKTEALKRVLREYGFDALIMYIRRDEHYMRNLERFYSPRDTEFKWHIVRPKTPGETGDSPFESLQNVELWDLFQTDFGKECSHVRVHPILHWTEADVWKYTRDNGIPFNPLYISRGGKRYRSLGCGCCTSPMESSASGIDEIIRELETTDVPERSGRAQDKEREDTMRRLRSLGYM